MPGSLFAGTGAWEAENSESIWSRISSAFFADDMTLIETAGGMEKCVRRTKMLMWR